MSRSTRITAVGAVAIAMAFIGSNLARGDSISTQAAAPTFVDVRGEQISSAGYSLRGLHREEDLDLIEHTRDEVFKTCMANRGFNIAAYAELSESESNEAELEALDEAAFGANAWEIGPPEVRLPDGTTTTDGMVFQPGSCLHEAEMALGVDPYLREALRFRIMVLALDADQRTIESDLFQDRFETWSRCTGNDDPWAMLDALEPASARHADRRIGSAEDSPERRCITEEDRVDLLAERGNRHAEATNANRLIVDAWIDTVDTQLSNARSHTS